MFILHLLLYLSEHSTRIFWHSCLSYKPVSWAAKSCTLITRLVNRLFFLYMCISIYQFIKEEMYFRIFYSQIFILQPVLFLICWTAKFFTLIIRLVNQFFSDICDYKWIKEELFFSVFGFRRFILACFISPNLALAIWHSKFCLCFAPH